MKILYLNNRNGIIIWGLLKAKSGWKSPKQYMYFKNRAQRFGSELNIKQWTINKTRMPSTPKVPSDASFAIRLTYHLGLGGVFQNKYRGVFQNKYRKISRLLFMNHTGIVAAYKITLYFKDGNEYCTQFEKIT